MCGCRQVYISVGSDFSSKRLNTGYQQYSRINHNCCTTALLYYTIVTAEGKLLRYVRQFPFTSSLPYIVSFPPSAFEGRQKTFQYGNHQKTFLSRVRFFQYGNHHKTFLSRVRFFRYGNHHKTFQKSSRILVHSQHTGATDLQSKLVILFQVGGGGGGGVVECSSHGTELGRSARWGFVHYTTTLHCRCSGGGGGGGSTQGGASILTFFPVLF